MGIYTFFVLQPYAFLAHNIHITDINNSEYNTGVKRAAKQVWNTPAFLDQKSWNL